MNDKTLRELITDELDFEPSIDSADIGVAVENGIVTLTGHVPNFGQKSKIEEIVGRIKGVRGIAEEIDVRFAGEKSTADDVLAKRAADLIRWNAFVPEGAVQVKIERGYVTLSGEVDWQYQRDSAYRAVRDMNGIVGVSNKITLRPRTSGEDVRIRIENALKRNAEIEAKGIIVQVRDGTVTLEGKVKSWWERGAAERAAWAAPGIKHVDDRLNVG
jgi:Predicted periplasmic or secreted lipoprotein